MSVTTPSRLSKMRRSYERGELLESDLAKSPFDQFGRWFDDAVAANLRDANAMTLATVDSGGNADARIVLLKGFDERGFVFYTNYQSSKAKELRANRSVALVFFWTELERQVRIRGRAIKVPYVDSLGYFHSRPRESQIASLASKQSDVLSSREELEERVRELTKASRGKAIPLPKNAWGGYRVVPTDFEFWQGGPSRLHDRFHYVKTGRGFRSERLYP